MMDNSMDTREESSSSRESKEPHTLSLMLGRAGVEEVVVPELEELMKKPHQGYRFWTPWEDAVVRTYYGKVGTGEIAKRLDRSREAVAKRHSRLVWDEKG